jgi:hypothetical protein
VTCGKVVSIGSEPKYIYRGHGMLSFSTSWLIGMTSFSPRGWPVSRFFDRGNRGSPFKKPARRLPWRILQARPRFRQLTQSWDSESWEFGLFHHVP